MSFSNKNIQLNYPQFEIPSISRIHFPLSIVDNIKLIVFFHIELIFLGVFFRLVTYLIFCITFKRKSFLFIMNFNILFSDYFVIFNRVQINWLKLFIKFCVPILFFVTKTYFIFRIYFFNR